MLPKTQRPQSPAKTKKKKSTAPKQPLPPRPIWLPAAPRSPLEAFMQASQAAARWPLVHALEQHPRDERRQLMRKLHIDRDRADAQIGALAMTVHDIQLLTPPNQSDWTEDQWEAASRIIERVRKLVVSASPKGRAKGGPLAAQKRHTEHDETKVKPYRDEYRKRLLAGEKSADIIEDMAKKYDTAGYAKNPMWAKKRMRDIIKPRLAEKQEKT